MNVKISACMIVKNAENTLLECLKSLESFDEIIMINNNSSDSTLAIAEAFNQHYQRLKIYHSDFIGFGGLKNLALKYATNDWVFFIDSDEVLLESALAEINTLQLSQNHIYALPRQNLYKNEWIKACGWHPDFVWRIFHKQFTRFNDNIVHESVILPQGAQRLYLKNGLKHYAFKDIESLLDKLQRYTSYSAQEKFAKGRKTTMFAALARLGLVFIKDYFFRKGIFYGYKGFMVAFCNALGAFFRYAKLYEKHKDKK